MFNSLIRGGQISIHRWRMTGQVIKMLFCMGLVLSLVGPAWQMWNFKEANPAKAAGALYYVKAKTLYRFHSDSHLIDYEDYSGRVGKISLEQIRSTPNFKASFDQFISQGWLGVKKGMIGTGIILGVFMLRFGLLGFAFKRKSHLKGSRLIRARRLKLRMLIFPWRKGKYRIAGVPWPKGNEQLHTLIVGTTGSGKTVCISDLLEQIEKQGGKAIVYDKMGSFIPYFYRSDRDFILNPFDYRDARWDLFGEAESETDFNTFAAALIPEFKDTADPFWTGAARQLFATGASSMWKAGDHDMPTLIHNLVKTNMTELAELMENTEMQSIIDPKNAKTALSVRSVLTTHIQPLRLLNPAENGFSIRKWVQDDSKSGFLFLSSHAGTHEVRRSQISTQIELALVALLSLKRNPNRRLWFIIDELPSLQKVPSLISGLREIRQFGGCIVLGAQVFSEIRDLYGREAAASISGNCNTRLCLSSPDRDTAQWMSDNLGRAVTSHMNEAISYGAETYRDGVSHTKREDVQPIVLPAEIMGLPPLVGFLKMPFGLPVAKVSIKPKGRATIAVGFDLFIEKDPETGEIDKTGKTSETGETGETSETDETNETDDVIPSANPSGPVKGVIFPPDEAKAGQQDASAEDAEWKMVPAQRSVSYQRDDDAPPPEAYEGDLQNTRHPRDDHRKPVRNFDPQPSGQKPLSFTENTGDATATDAAEKAKKRTEDILEKHHPKSHQAQKPHDKDKYPFEGY